MKTSRREETRSLEIDPSVFIAPGAVVVGTVRLAARASVWFNAVVRGDSAPIEVGEETNLQDNVTVHVDEGKPARIGARVTVGHGAVVHGCVVEDDCLVGMGAIVLSGARVGRGSLIGAGALVREGQEIPPKSVALGAPARVAGPTSDAHAQAIRSGAAHYVSLARLYLERFGSLPPVAERGAGRSATDRGPMSYFEWEQLVETLAQSPGWAAARGTSPDDPRWRVAPGPGSWSALEVLCHLCDADLDVYEPRLERLLAEPCPFIEDVDMRGWDVAREYVSRSTRMVLAAWSTARARLVARLAPLGPEEWDRTAVHSVRGPFTLAAMVRGFVEHDLSHRRQLARALGASA